MNQKNDIRNELIELGINLPLLRENPFESPTNFFELFNSQLLDKIQEITTNVSKEMPFELQMDYFNNNPKQILELAKQEDFISNLPKAMPFETPINYFSTFKVDTIQLISEQKVMPFSIPEAYFENTPIEILASIKGPKQELAPLTFRKKYLTKLSLVATLFLFIGLAFKTMITPSIVSLTSHNVAEQKLSILSDADIDAYFQMHQTELESDMAVTAFDAKKVDLQILENEVYENSLNNLSDEELAEHNL